MNILLKGVDVFDANFEIVKNTNVAIAGDTISYIGTDKKAIDLFLESHKGDIETYGMQGHLIAPALYNAHNHSPMTVLRGVGSGLSLHDWLNTAIFPIEDRMTADDAKIGVRLAIMEMLKCGTCSFSDMYFFADTICEEVISSGMKANVSRALVGFDRTENYFDSRYVRESIELFDKYHNSANGRVKVDFSVHAEYTSFPELVEKHSIECRARGANMHIHLSETQKETDECRAKYGKSPVEYFADLGVFANNTTAAHCIWLDDSDIQILKQHNVSTVHNPTSNLKLGSGVMPLGSLLKAGVNVCLGTDGAASNNNMDMFEEIHLASLLHNGVNHDPTLIQPVDVLKMATIAGARAQGRQNAGSIAVGHKADLVAIDMNKPHLKPNLDTLALMTYSMNSNDVALTMIDGKIVYKNGEFLTIDTEEIDFLLAKSANRLYKRA